MRTVAGPYGDIRDVLTRCPRYNGDGYPTLDLFTVRHELIRALDPQPQSVFEFGALVGYFLMTAVDAAPTIEHVGWIDNETHTQDSNAMCRENLEWLAEQRPLRLWHGTIAGQCREFGQADLVQVDAGHSYSECLTDLIWALELGPRVIMVDDYAAIGGVQEATDRFADWHGFELERYETRNGLAVLRIR